MRLHLQYDPEVGTAWTGLQWHESWIIRHYLLIVAFLPYKTQYWLATTLHPYHLCSVGSWILKQAFKQVTNQSCCTMWCAYRCYAPLPPVWALVGQGGDLTNLNTNCPNIRDIPYNQIPLQKVGDYWGFDTCSVTVQYTETIAVFKMSSEVIKCPTIGAAFFGQSPYIARHGICPYGA